MPVEAQRRRWLVPRVLQMDQLERRLLRGGAIPHDEKMYSICQPQPHTRWVAKKWAHR